MRSTTYSVIKFCLVVVSLIFILSFAEAAHLVSVCTCSDVRQPDIIPVGIREKFEPDVEAIHAVVVMDTVRPGTKIKGNWVSVDAIEIPDYQIDSAEVEAKSAVVRAHFSLSKPANGWPVGDYRLDVYVDNKFSTSAPFTIVKKTKQPGSSSVKAKNEPEPGLLGTWYCQTSMGTSVLIFQTDDRLSLDGQQASYKIVGSALRVQDDYGTEDYPYKISNGTLTIRFPEGFELQFVKQSNEAHSAGESIQGQYDDFADTEADDGNEQNSAPSGGNDLMQHFAGTWWNASRNTETLVTLTADGRYYENYTASYSGSSGDQYGNETMNWGAAGDQQASGQWTVQGNRERGQLTIVYPNGNQRVISYQVHVENGEFYWSEYYFNGELYGKK